ncbi:MAG: radical SAM protein [Actinomycetota bacterium]|nr:radical SAM protein [Actinomycetota bacterium]
MRSVGTAPLAETDVRRRSGDVGTERPRRIAVCGGPYANPYALSAFVTDARRRGCEQLYCLGDLGGFGAEINALWPILQAADITCVAGNYDVAIARGDPDCGCGYRDPTDNRYAQLIYDHTRTHTSPGFAAWMGRLPTERRERIGGSDVHLVHGSPIALNDFWWESLPDDEHALRVAASGADVICCTHSGLPWQRRVGGTLVVNVGVLGKPANDGRREAWYAILDVADGQATAELVPLAYDWRSQAHSMRQAAIPELFVETIETGWWTTCIEVLPPAERARGRYHLYRSSFPTAFSPAGGTWSDDDDGSRSDTASANPQVDTSTAPRSDHGAADGEHLPVVPLFGSAYFPRRLWIYTNFHCNLACDYCAVGSSPRALPRLLSAERFRALVDEAVTEGFTELYLTGGEPLLHPDIAELLACGTAALPTVLLTNATVLRATRLARLRAFAGNPNLVVQTSLDGARPVTHDAHRGAGTWAKTMDGIATLVDLGLAVRVAMTETPENTGEVTEVADLLAGAGVPADSFVVRPLLRRGLSDTGLDITETSTVPELTVAADGLYWHPAGADRRSSPDMRIAESDCTLAHAQQLVVRRFLAARLGDGSMPRPYRCAV